MGFKSKKRISADDEYESDGGFVAAEEDGPKSKKTKTGTSTSASTKGVKVPGGGSRDEDGAEFWELSKNRRVTVSEFRGKYMVNLREYYEKDGKSLPGKKGISLPIDQFNALVAVLPHLETALKAVGEEILRPNYDGDDEAEDDSRLSPVKAASKEPKRQKNGIDKKKNFEATSDEDEADDDGE
ncbi:MAG: hypothetical protein M1825_004168 [Sarcosagium campestre]|nr:MAG: hypothetical protein M1825_004168 [Sarcosagium campestre]